MSTNIATGRSTFLPSNRCLTPDGFVLIANGLDPAKIHKRTDTTVYNAGIPLAVNGSFSGSWGTAGSISGTYYYAFRYIDVDGVPGDLSVLQSAVASSHSTISYSNIPVSSDARVAGRQIFRSTAGQSLVLYLDKQIDDNSTTSTTSTNSDTTLQAATALAINAPDGSVFARRFGVPPAHMRLPVYHNNRSFWLVSAKYTEGHCEVTNGSATVQIRAGQVTADMDARKFKVDDYATEYTIDSVNTGSNTLTLTENYGGTTNKFANYSVHAARIEGRRVRWSYPGEPESCYTNDAVDLEAEQSAGEDLTGAISFNSFLYLFTPSACYRWSFADVPVNGNIYHTEDRGMLNPRTYCRFENQVAVMDRTGIYVFNGGNANPISNVITDWIAENVVWDNSEWFHASAYPAEETVKFFVCLDGSRYPKHSICFNYRTVRWWWEEYPWEIGASATVPVASRRELLVGGENERILIHDRYADIPTHDREVAARHAVTSASYDSVVVTVDWATESDLIGAPLAIVSGKGKGQWRTIVGASTSTGRIKVDQPFLDVPDTTSEVAIGGVHWLLSTKVFEASPEADSPHVGVFVTPTDHDASFDLKFSYNHRTTFVNSDRGDTSHPGILRTKDRPDVECQIGRDQDDGEFTGYYSVPLDTGFDGRAHATARYQQFTLEGFQSRDPVLVHGIDVAGVE